MDDLISRSVLLKAMGLEYKDTERLIQSGETYLDNLAEGYTEVYNLIKSAPAIEAEPVRHGRWVDRMVRDWRCSECGEAIYKVRNVDGYCYDDKPNYCPNCGAKMDSEVGPEQSKTAWQR